MVCCDTFRIKMKSPSCKLLLLTVFVSFCCMWPFGYQISYMNTSGRSFQTILHNTTDSESVPFRQWLTQWSIVITIFYLGAFFGLCLTPFFTRKLGMKMAAIISAIPAILGYILAILGYYGGQVKDSEGTFLAHFLIFTRLLIGFHAGAAVAILPMWVRETSQPPQRGVLCSLQQVSMGVSVFIGFICGTESILGVVSHFVELQVIALIPTVALVIFFICVPETPHHYFHRKSNWNKGEASILFYYGKNTDIEAATLSIMQEWSEHSEAEYTGGYRVRRLFCSCKSAESWQARLAKKGVFMATLAAFSYAFTADVLIDTFSQYIFERLYGATFEDQNDAATYFANYWTIGMGGWLIVCSFCGIFVVEKLGRRKSLIYGLFGCSLGNMLTALLCKIPSSSTSLAYASIASVFLTKACTGLFAGPPAWFIASELVPATARLTAQTISSIGLMVMCGAVSALYLHLDAQIGSLCFLLLCAAPAVLCAIALLMYLPETVDKEVYEIQLELDTEQPKPRGRDVLAGWSRRWKDYGSIANRHRKNTQKIEEEEEEEEQEADV